MPADLSAIAGEYLRDILSQPQALQSTLAGLEQAQALENLAKRLHQGKFQRIVLTGMGASFYALHPLRVQLIDHGFTALMAETSELIHYERRFLDPGSLMIAVSQSGRSAEVVRLLEMRRGRGALIAVTNTPGSPLARRADVAVLTNAGAEFSVSCKTYVTALMALQWLGEILCGKDLRRTRRELNQVVESASAYLSNWESHVRCLVSRVENVRDLFLVGRGPSLAAAETGGLIIKESTHFHAEGMSSAAFRHGPYEMLSRETLVLVFAGEARTRDLNLKLLRDIRKQGARAEIVSEDAELEVFRLPAAPSSVRAILEILPIHMVTLALAACAGREPGRFTLLTKVTTAE